MGECKVIEMRKRYIKKNSFMQGIIENIDGRIGIKVTDDIGPVKRRLKGAYAIIVIFAKIMERMGVTRERDGLVILKFNIQRWVDTEGLGS